MVAAGIIRADVAKVMGISENTLRKYYSLELDTAHTEATASMAYTVFKAGLEDWRAALKWLQMRAGWVPKQTVEVVDNTAEKDAERQSLLRRATDLLGPMGEVHNESDSESSN